MADELRLKTDKVPSYFNETSAKWWAVGSILPIPFGGIVGGVLGAIKGKEEMQQDLVSGKPVSENQSVFNSGMLVDGYISVIATVFVAALLTGFNPPLGITALAVAGMAAIGGYSGGKSKQEERLAEYEEAKVQQAQGVGIGQERSQNISEEVSRAHTITPEEAQLLESRMKHSGQGNHNFTEALDTQKTSNLQQGK